MRVCYVAIENGAFREEGEQYAGAPDYYKVYLCEGDEFLERVKRIDELYDTFSGCADDAEVQAEQYQELLVSLYEIMGHCWRYKNRHLLDYFEYSNGYVQGVTKAIVRYDPAKSNGTSFFRFFLNVVLGSYRMQRNSLLYENRKREKRHYDRMVYMNDFSAASVNGHTILHRPDEEDGDYVDDPAPMAYTVIQDAVSEQEQMFLEDERTLRLLAYIVKLSESAPKRVLKETGEKLTSKEKRALYSVLFFTSYLVDAVRESRDENCFKLHARQLYLSLDQTLLGYTYTKKPLDLAQMRMFLLKKNRDFFEDAGDYADKPVDTPFTDRLIGKYLEDVRHMKTTTVAYQRTEFLRSVRTLITDA